MYLIGTLKWVTEVNCLAGYESSEFTKSDSFIILDLEDLFSALTLKFDFLPRK